MCHRCTRHSYQAGHKVATAVVAIHDLLPTLAGATGVPLKQGKPLDGKNVWSSLVAGTTQPRTMVIAEEDFAIFRDQWKLIQTAGGDLELYDIAGDPSRAK